MSKRFFYIYLLFAFTTTVRAEWIASLAAGYRFDSIRTVQEQWFGEDPAKSYRFGAVEIITTVDRFSHCDHLWIGGRFAFGSVVYPAGLSKSWPWLRSFTIDFEAAIGHSYHSSSGCAFFIPSVGVSCHGLSHSSESTVVYSRAYINALLDEVYLHSTVGYFSRLNCLIASGFLGLEERILLGREICLRVVLQGHGGVSMSRRRTVITNEWEKEDLAQRGNNPVIGLVARLQGIHNLGKGWSALVEINSANWWTFRNRAKSVYQVADHAGNRFWRIGRSFMSFGWSTLGANLGLQYTF